MRKLFQWMSLGMFLLPACFWVSGCGPTTYQRAGILGGGFRDNPEAGAAAGTYEIYFVGQGRTYEFTKYAVYYRAAEVAYNNNYRYFSILKLDDLSQTITSPNGGAVNASNSTIPVIKLHIQCFTEKPAQACYSVEQCLNAMKVPGTQTIYGIAQRHADQLAGNYKVQE